MSNEFEVVYTIEDYWDGPRKGIANFRKKPHVYECRFDSTEDRWSDIFLLMPIDEKTFDLAREKWELWSRWLSAFNNGEASLSSHPVLPQDKARQEQLKSLLGESLVVDPKSAIQAKAEFRPIQDTKMSSQSQLTVKWIPTDN